MPYFRKNKMKKLVYIFLTFAMTANAFGQKSNFYVGIVGGPSKTFLNGFNYTEEPQKPILSFFYGLYLQNKISNIFSIRTDIQFERKGALYSGTFYYSTNPYFFSIDTAHYTSYSHMDYITIPILLSTTIDKKIKYYLNTGFYAGYLMKQESIYHATAYYPDTIRKNTDDYQMFDYGISAGIGISIPINNLILVSFEIRNNWGLYDIMKDDRFTMKTNSLNLRMGFVYTFDNVQTEKE
ncbi:MAG: hypothetical protein COZ21_10825 [Bacteroidetes bacterium CG_4_10_14_3_um_filter_31_20]|nr:MAG: hypothetical protein COZ21_10825 [Bacteroidetes bacterium CG_4_10_14_3_um_filter_31_20]